MSFINFQGARFQTEKELKYICAFSLVISLYFLSSALVDYVDKISVQK